MRARRTVAGVAAKFGVHRRMVRQALASALPPERRYPQRARPKLDGVAAFIDQVLEQDLRAPRKQRHTARRIGGAPGAEERLEHDQQVQVHG